MCFSFHLVVIVFVVVIILTCFHFFHYNWLLYNVEISKGIEWEEQVSRQEAKRVKWYSQLVCDSVSVPNVPKHCWTYRLVWDLLAWALIFSKITCQEERRKEKIETSRERLGIIINKYLKIPGRTHPKSLHCECVLPHSATGPSWHMLGGRISNVRTSKE